MMNKVKQPSNDPILKMEKIPYNRIYMSIINSIVFQKTKMLAFNEDQDIAWDVGGSSLLMTF